MLRAERPRLGDEYSVRSETPPSPREVLLAVAPPPKTPSYVVSGWPDWLIPAYRSGGHRPAVHLLGEER